MHSFLLAWRYVAYHRMKTAILVACITLTAYLPVAVHWLVDYLDARLRARAEATPLVIGAPGSRFDLVLHALYFEGRPPDEITAQTVDDVRVSGLAMPIPLDVRFRARGFPIVGTSLDYFSFRKLRIVSGSQLARLGDCVLGATVARKLGLAPGDRLMSDAENVFDIAGTYPLVMRVVGVVGQSHSADDDAVFVDVKTARVIRGLGHGHQDLKTSNDQSVILARSDEKVVANAALVHYNEITDENFDSFHFHGPAEAFPLTAVLAVPHDQKSEDLLRGRYGRRGAGAQILKPDVVVEELMGMVFKVKRFFDAHVALVTLSTIGFLVLVVLLSLQLRQREMETMFKLGSSRLVIARLQAAELAIVLGVSFSLVGLLTLATVFYAPYIVRSLIL